MLKEKQLQLQSQGIDNLIEKYEQKENKKSSKTKSSELFASLYLKKISHEIDKQKKEDLATIVRKLYKKKKIEVNAIIGRDIKDYALDDLAGAIVPPLLELISEKKVSKKYIPQGIKNSQLIHYTYNALFQEFSNQTIELKQSGQVFAFYTFLLSSYEVTWIAFQSIMKLLTVDIGDNEDNSTSLQQISNEISQNILGHINYRLKQEGVNEILFETEENIELGSEIVKFLIDFDVLEKIQRENSFNNYTFSDMFLKNSKTFYKNILKYATPFYEPMIVKPLEWTTIDDGGFLKDEKSLAKYDLKILKMQSKRDAEVLEKLRDGFSPKLLKAINILQSTEWKINEEVLKYIQKNQNLKLKYERENLKSLKKELREKTEAIKTLKSMKLEIPKELLESKNSINKKIKELINDNQIKELILKTAEKYKNYDQIFFVWQIDFRGRTYPVQSLLHPQGDDFIKSLLHFSKKKQIDAQGVRWFKIHGANLYGEDKISFDDRVSWIDAHKNKILDLLNQENPFESQFLQNADKPYQFLAFSIEYKNYIQNPDKFYSSLPIAVDGSNNGFQHIATLLRDINGAKKVNVLPTDSDIPADIYKEVALESKKQFEKDIQNRSIDFVEQLEKILPLVNRSMTKPNVMTDSYGAGIKTKAKQIEEYLKDHNENFGKDMQKIATYIAKTNQTSIETLAPSSKKYKQWIKKIAKEVSKQNTPIEWTTPLIGFRVVQDEYKTKEHKIVTKYNGKTNQMQIKIPTNEIDLNAQSSAIAPNFIHSLDATHLYLTLLEANEMGIDNFATIHDSFATHANNINKLLNALKKSFIKLGNSDPLQQLKKEIEKTYKIKLSKIPYVDKEKFDLESIMKAKYFFG